MAENSMVRKQVPPIYQVKSRGVLIEMTDNKRTGDAAYNQADKTDKQLWRQETSGSMTLIARSRL